MMYPMLLGIAFPQLADEADNIYSTVIKQMSPWAYWRMDETAPANGDKLVDSSGNDRAGRYSLDSPVDSEALIRNETNDAAFVEYNLYPAGANIPDDSPVGYSNTVTVTETFTVKNIRVDVDITHTYIDDLEIYLSNGVDEVLFRPESGGSSNDIHASYASDGSLGADFEAPTLADLTGIPANTDWTIRVVDGYGEDTGTLDHWKLSLYGSAGIASCLSKKFSSSYIPIENRTTDKLGSELLPIREFEAWVVLADQDSEQLFFREGSQLFGWAVGVSGGEVCVGVATHGLVKKAAYNAHNLTLNVPYHVCAIVDLTNDRLKLYISSQLVDVVENAGLGTHASATGAVIGSGHDHNSGREYNPLTGNIEVCDFFGALDEMAIYDRERTEEERTLAYLTGDLGITPPLPAESGWVDLLPGYRRLHLAGAGSGIALAVNDSGEVSDWGWNSGGVSEPTGIGPVAQVSAYDYTYWAVTDSGAIHTWGDSLYIEAPLPNDLSSGYKAVSAGEGHVMLLREDGTVVCSGDNGSNQCDVPAGLSDVGVISAGGYFSAGIKNTGEVFVFGDSNDPRIQPPAGLVAVDISTRSYAIIAALSIEGDVVVWGNTDYGYGAMLNVPVIEGEVASIATTMSTVGVLKTDGTVQIWGEDYNGETLPPAELDRVIQLVGGDYYYLALRDDGSIVVIGSPGAHMNVPHELLGDTGLDDPFVPVVGPKSLTDAQLAYHVPFFGDGQNHGLLSASIYDLDSPNIGPAYDFYNRTYSGPDTHPPVLFGNALTVGDFPLSSLMGDGLNYTVILGFRTWDTDDDNPPSFGDLLKLTVNGVSVLRVSNEENLGTNKEEIFVRHRNQGNGSMDSAMISDGGRSFWRVLIITRQEDALTARIVAGHYNTVTIPMSSPLSPIHGLGPTESAILSLGASGMVISGLGIFDYALTTQEVDEVIDPFVDTGFDQFTHPPI